jgi:hypothetical protein
MSVTKRKMCSMVVAAALGEGALLDGAQGEQRG